MVVDAITSNGFDQGAGDGEEDGALSVGEQLRGGWRVIDGGAARGSRVCSRW